ncbi:MAG: hypothetical protein ABJC05_05270 [Pyrinomonadaceae bacterium]
MDHTRLSWRFRLLGLLPLIFFLAQGVHYWRIGQLGHMFWMCNIGNLLLAVGLLLGQPLLIRVAALWLVPGLAVWYWYVVKPFGFVLSSTLAHIGGLAVAMVVLQRVRVDTKAWMYALGWYFIVQLLSHFLTPVEMNVNLAQTVQAGWEQTFSSYWKFWLVLTLLVAAGLWGLGKVFSMLWPAPLSDNPRAPKEPETGLRV